MKLLKLLLCVTAFVALLSSFTLFVFQRFSFYAVCSTSFPTLHFLLPRVYSYLCSGAPTVATIMLFIVPVLLIVFFTGLSLWLNKKRMIIIVSVVFVCFSVIAHISNNRARALSNTAQVNTPIPNESHMLPDIYPI